MKTPEDVIQQECYMWFNKEFKHLRISGINHVPNGGKRTKYEAMKFVGIGVISGWPDIQILPGNGKIYFIEMKTETGRTSKDQDKVHADLTERGYKVWVARNLEQFKQAVKEIFEDYGKYEL